jgi:hypothetical protein
MRKFSLSALIILFTFSGILAQSNNNPVTLFQFEPGKQITEVLPEHETERYYISFNTNIAETGQLEPGNKIEFPVNGEVLTLSVLRVSQYMPETFSVIAREDADGTLLAFTIADDRVFGKLHHVAANELYHLDYDVNEGSNYLAKIAPTNLDVLECTIDDLHVHDDGRLHGDTQEFIERHKTARSPNVNAMASTLDDETTIDLMIVYTPAAVDWSLNSSFGSMGAVIAQSMNLSQGALDNSDIGIELRLVHSHLTDYDELNDGTTSNSRLRRLTSSPTYRPASWSDDFGYMDEVHILRDQYGADLVAGFFNVSDTGGLAWVLSNTGGSPLIGFSLNRVQQIATGYTLIHEIGHNMGNLHARNQTTQAAGAVGGIFHYSVGYRWETVNGNYNTVMAYSQGFQQAPLFSSPDLTFGGTPAGTYEPGVGPTDNRRSMREIKRAIASYRPTVIDSPEKTVSTDAVTVTMNREDYTEVSISINNDGDSNLMWFVDFDFPSHAVLPKMKTPADIESLDSDDSVTPDVPTGASELAAADHDGTIFSEDFSTFSTGTFPSRNEWRGGNNSTLFEVSTSNPSTGSNHIRLRSNSIDTNTLRVRSPYFGPQPFGEFELSMDIAIFPDAGSQQVERHDIYVYDGATGSISSGLVFSNNTIFAWGFNAEGGTSFLSTGFSYTLSEYKNVRIVYNSSHGVIEYFYDNQKIAERPYTLGTTIDYFHVLNFNDTELGFIDIDNITVKRPHIFPWLEVEKYAGSAGPEGTDNLVLQFNTQGIAAGTYDVDMYIYSNDPEQEFKKIPVRLNVNNEVSTETIDGRPESISLSQNYPNPFNPGTMIRYDLPVASEVRLEVFDLLGRKVATLENGLVQSGTHEVYFNASGLSSGIYIYRLHAGQQVLTRQMVLVK